ncbi:hypothetical protein BCR33DRAFT_344098 [Rhizoclosmatium globosum]|uniref:RING-type domain-containing protein n=1 Tax=Rhizoclosmatium globosum TaxID=329046 RepID=A0A1Y2C350_9FUNG|nr:hypothetical protein BCR33DRAFT_344098 [Rhizoclosmatium globosum]|eukprot:ORY41314.1 hypothetical protein BCR33DRAFT_344098 [Rhizoclosmatium globosum]
MIKVKKSEIARLDATRDRIESRIASAEASIKYIDAITNSSTHVKITERVSGYGGGSFTFYDMSALLGEKVEEWAEVDETGRVRLRAPTIDGGGAVGYVRAEEGMQTLSQLGHVERMAFVKSSKEWIEGERRELEEVAREKAQVEAEIRYFLGMVEGLKNAEAGNTGNVVVVKESESAVKDEDGEKNTSTEPTVTLEDATTDSETVEATTENKEDTKENSQECLLCAEDVTMLAVLSCGHSSCRRCLNAWMEKNKSCPTCRKIIKDGDEIFEVTTGTKVEPVAPVAPVTVVPPVIERPEPMVFKPVPPIVMKHGTKPAAVADFLRKTLAASPDNRIIVFSKWHSMLNLLAKTLNALNIPNLFPKKALNQKVAQEAYEATTMSTPVSKGKKRALPSSTPDQYETSTSRIADPINEFKTSSEFRILMLSLQESASGTNLQCANTIVMLEPASGDNSAHAIATEQQAIGRAVRFGVNIFFVIVRLLTKKILANSMVRVYKFIVRGTIEEDLYRFQETERKKRVMLTEGNVVHLRRRALIEVDADFTSTDIVIGEDRIVEEEEWKRRNHRKF